MLQTNPMFIELPEEDILLDLQDYPAVFMMGIMAATTQTRDASKGKTKSNEAGPLIVLQ